MSGAIRTDFILSAEIMVIALKEVIDEPLVSRAIILVVVALVITVVVYGTVALIVKMDDIGLDLVEQGSPSKQRTGRLLVSGMPKVLKVLSVVGTAAMLWVGGHIILVGFDELGWHWPYGLVHDLEHAVEDIAGIGGVLAWLVNTAASAAVGLAVGTVIVFVVAALPIGKGRRGSASSALTVRCRSCRRRPCGSTSGRRAGPARRVEVGPVADRPGVGRARGAVRAFQKVVDSPGCWTLTNIVRWSGVVIDAGDLAAARAGEEPADLAGVGVGGQHLVVADAVVAPARQVLGAVGDVGLDPQPAVGVEPRGRRASRRCSWSRRASPPGRTAGSPASRKMSHVEGAVRADVAGSRASGRCARTGWGRGGLTARAGRRCRW